MVYWIIESFKDKLSKLDTKFTSSYKIICTSATGQLLRISKADFNKLIARDKILTLVLLENLNRKLGVKPDPVTEKKFSSTLVESIEAPLITLAEKENPTKADAINKAKKDEAVAVKAIHEKLLKRDLIERDQHIEIARDFPTMRRVIGYDSGHSKQSLAVSKIAYEFS